MKNLSIFLVVLFASLLASCTTESRDPVTGSTPESTSILQTDPLPSWNEGPTKDNIIAFVSEVTQEGSQDFIPAEYRIATFDNDGTLWSEQPAYFQLFFALDRIKEMAPDHPEWNDQEPYKSVLDNDMTSLMAQGEKGLLTIMATSHAGMTVSEFESIVTGWMSTAKHPTKDRHYNQLVYQPMLELLDYLRASDFRTYIVSGGGIEFMRPWTYETYGIPPEQVVGSSIKTKYDYNDGNPVIRRLPEIDFIDDKEGKPEGINKHIGLKPVFAAGNSDGDLQMLRWTDSNDRKSFQLYIHHTDSTREWAYDRDSHIGTFDVGLDEAIARGWTLVDMAKDWKVIYPE